MDNQSLAKLYENQISFTEWFSRINHRDTEAMREEDNEKRERLKILHNFIGLPFDQPVQFLAHDIVNRTTEFQEYLQEHGNDPCALRLIPLHPELPKLRMRGSSVRNVLTWFTEQKINPEEYRADFVPHSEKPTWSTIFIVNKQGIFGEIIAGGHYQLTQGFYAGKIPIVFSYDFSTWRLSEENSEVMNHLQEIVSWLAISKEKKAGIQHQMTVSFAHDMLCGYFETTSSEDCGLWFVDYNRLLGKMYEQFVLPPLALKEDGFLVGQGAAPGKACGKVKIITKEKLSQSNLFAGEILVTDMTTPEFVPFMQRAAAIVTNIGGILTHAAIISRELGIPCLTGTIDATKKLKDGDLVEVDADKGIVRKMNTFI